jgi:hypothetical protein
MFAVDYRDIVADSALPDTPIRLRAPLKIQAKKGRNQGNISG